MSDVTFELPREFQADLRLEAIGQIKTQARAVIAWADNQLPLTDWSDAPTPASGSRMIYPGLTGTCEQLNGLHDLMAQIGLCGEATSMYLSLTRETVRLIAEASIGQHEKLKEEYGRDGEECTYNNRAIHYWTHVLESSDRDEIELPEEFYPELVAA